MSQIGAPALRCPECPAIFSHPDDLAAHASRRHPDGESTSARLRRVEQERAELRNQLDMAVMARQVALQAAADAVSARDDALAKREQAYDSAETWYREWQLAKAELATARAELGHLRRERDQLRIDLTEALGELDKVSMERLRSEGEP